MEAHRQIQKKATTTNFDGRGNGEGRGGASAAEGKERGKGIEMVMEIGHDLQRLVARAVEQ